MDVGCGGHRSDAWPLLGGVVAAGFDQAVLRVYCGFDSSCLGFTAGYMERLRFPPLQQQARQNPLIIKRQLNIYLTLKLNNTSPLASKIINAIHGNEAQVKYQSKGSYLEYIG